VRQRRVKKLTLARGRTRIFVGIAPPARHFAARIDSLILSTSPTGGRKAAMPHNRTAAAAFFCLATLAAASFGAATNARAADPLGTWYTEGKESQVRIVKCGNALCGALVWLKEPNDPKTGKPKTDENNADAGLAKRPLLGVQIVLGMAPTGTADQWKGKVYNAKDGNTYTGYFTLTGADTAELKGCALGFICKSQTWTRAKP
jgi:uncharacterized protein (DUF2147 family)